MLFLNFSTVSAYPVVTILVHQIPYAVLHFKVDQGCKRTSVGKELNKGLPVGGNTYSIVRALGTIRAGFERILATYKFRSS